jgi:hypothetical protein
MRGLGLFWDRYLIYILSNIYIYIRGVMKGQISWNIEMLLTSRTVAELNEAESDKVVTSLLSIGRYETVKTPVKKSGDCLNI